MKNNKKTQQRIKGNHKKTELNQLITKNKKSKNISQKRTMKKNAKDRKKENKTKWWNKKKGGETGT